jgi:hypothetical protein
MRQAARRRTSQTVAAMSSTDSASSQPPSIHWNGQNLLAGWYLANPGDSILSALIAAEEEGDPLSCGEVVSTAFAAADRRATTARSS